VGTVKRLALEMSDAGILHRGTAVMSTVEEATTATEMLNGRWCRGYGVFLFRPDAPREGLLLRFATPLEMWERWVTIKYMRLRRHLRRWLGLYIGLLGV
jgi:hypothetical protein